MGKTRVIAETGAGQHGVATATACALLGLECVVYMGEVDTERQALNVARMRLLGAEVIPVTTGSRTLKDAINEALRDWVATVDDTHYLLGTVAGPHPFPTMVRDFHRVIGLEAREQVLERTGRLPDAVAACVGGGSNAIGIFHAFLDDPDVRLVGFEPGGDGVETGRHGATLSEGSPGALHGAMSYLLQDEDGQTAESYSISAGLDYPGVGPEHALLKDIGRATYEPVTDAEAMDAFALLSPHRGDHPGDRVRARHRGRAAPGPRAGARGRHPGEPVRAGRQGRRHRGEVVQAVKRRGSRPVETRSSQERARAEGRAALVGYLPAGYPTVDGSVEMLSRDGRGRLRPPRGRRALLRPRDGRPHHPGRRRHRAARRGAAARRVPRGRAGGRGGRPGRRHDLLQPGAALRRRRVRARPRRGGRPRRDHPGPHPRRGRRVARRVRRARPRPDLPGRAVVHRGADRLDRRRDPRVPLRRVDDGRHRRPRRGGRRRAAARRALPGAHHAADRGRAGRAVAGAGGRGRRRSPTA